MSGLAPTLVAVALWLAGPATSTTPVPPADPLINAFMVSINRDPPETAPTPKDRARAVCRRTLAENLDFDALLARARIPALVGMTDDQRRAFRSAAERWLVSKCVERSHDHERLDFVGLRPGEDGDRLLATRSSQTRHMIVWRLRGTGPLTAADLIVDGSSTAQRLRDEVEILLRSSDDDVNAMIALLGRKAR